MALDNYSNLKASIEDWSHRNDVSERLDDFIRIAEQEMFNNTVEVLNVRGQEADSTTTTSTNTRFHSLPADYLSMRRILLDDRTTDAQQFELKYYTPEVLPISSRVGRPTLFTVTSQIEFNCPTDQAYDIDILYYAKPTALSAANTTNIVLTETPSVYLYGSLWALYQWALDLEKAEYFYNKFLSAIVGANKNNRKGRYGPAPVQRLEGRIV
jgi:hypothetical protein